MLWYTVYCIPGAITGRRIFQSATCCLLGTFHGLSCGKEILLPMPRAMSSRLSRGKEILLYSPCLEPCRFFSFLSYLSLVIVSIHHFYSCYRYTFCVTLLFLYIPHATPLPSLLPLSFLCYVVVFVHPTCHTVP